MAHEQTGIQSPTLIVLAGLPGVGKTIIARSLAGEIEAVYLRIDSIEQALRDSAGLTQPMDESGYCAAYALAEDNLRIGRTVIADCVNPIRITRKAWREVANELEHACLKSRFGVRMSKSIDAGLNRGHPTSLVWFPPPGMRFYTANINLGIAIISRSTARGRRRTRLWLRFVEGLRAEIATTSRSL